VYPNTNWNWLLPSIPKGIGIGCFHGGKAAALAVLVHPKGLFFSF
jgi:hypothetical protein